MVQDIITSAIIATSAGYTLYNLYAMFIPAKKKVTSNCSGCSGCSMKIAVKGRI